MVNEGKSKKASKRLQKEADLVVSSWKLADQLYTSFYGDCWPEIKQELLKPAEYALCSVTPKNGELLFRDKLSYRLSSNTGQGDFDFYVDQEALFLFEIMELSSKDNFLDMFGSPGYLAVLVSHMLKNLSFTTNGATPSSHQKLRSRITENASNVERIRVTGWDAVKFGVAEASTYSKVLLVAPSSDEKVTFTDEKLLKKWTDKVTRQNAKKQLLNLISALSAATPGGTVFYVTKSMSPFENDEVVEKALKKSRTEPVAIKVSSKIGRSTKYGIQILPHEAPFGPLYVSKLKIQE